VIIVRTFQHTLVVVAALFGASLHADPVPVKRICGYLHGFLVIKSLDDKILASGTVTQVPAGNRITATLSFQFKDGSLYQETSVFSQHRVFQLLTYKQVQKGPSFRTQQAITLDVPTGKVNVHYTDKHGKSETIADTLSLPPDLANGIIPTLLSDVDPKAETTLSMLVFQPKPRIVKLKIEASEQDSFSVGGTGGKATHYVVKIDLGAITGTVAKVVGKQPPPIHFWVSANAPVFLKSEGPLFEDGPIWRIELASPIWPKQSSQ
jgi:hypothetical protein